MAREHARPSHARMQHRKVGDHETEFVGYASTTGVAYDVSDWLGTYRETIMPGAFKRAIGSGGYVPLLVDHDGYPLAAYRGRSDGTMTLYEDGTGLCVTSILDRRSGTANDVAVALERGDLDKMSFAFRAAGASDQKWDANYTARQINALDLYDVSIVKNPANPTTTAGLRSAIAAHIGRDGRTVLRSALPQKRTGQPGIGQLDAALRAFSDVAGLVEARSDLASSKARVTAVRNLLREKRAGKVLSAASEQLVNNALAALADAGGHLTALKASSDSDALDDGDGSSDSRNQKRAVTTVEDAAARAQALRYRSGPRTATRQTHQTSSEERAAQAAALGKRKRQP